MRTGRAGCWLRRWFAGPRCGSGAGIARVERAERGGNWQARPAVVAWWVKRAGPKETGLRVWAGEKKRKGPAGKEGLGWVFPWARLLGWVELLL